MSDKAEPIFSMSYPREVSSRSQYCQESNPATLRPGTTGLTEEIENAPRLLAKISWNFDATHKILDWYSI